MKHFFVLLALIGFGLSSCERHTWETKKEDGGPKTTDTINLFKHEEHAGDEHPEGDKQAEGAAHPEGEKPTH